MPIHDEVQKKLQEAMRARDAARLSALRMIRAALLEEAKSGSGEMDDARCVAIVQRVRKQRIDAAETYTAAGRPDLAELELAESRIAEEFLPRQADEATTLAWVREAIAATGARGPKEMGRVMGMLMKAHKAELDAAVARGILERELAALES
jgi:hypothetical protein